MSPTVALLLSVQGLPMQWMSLGSGLKTRTGICSQTSPEPSWRAPLPWVPFWVPQMTFKRYCTPRHQEVLDTVTAPKSLGSPPHMCPQSLHRCFQSIPEPRVTLSQADPWGPSSQRGPCFISPGKHPRSSPRNEVQTGVSRQNHAQQKGPDLPGPTGRALPEPSHPDTSMRGEGHQPLLLPASPHKPQSQLGSS